MCGCAIARASGQHEQGLDQCSLLLPILREKTNKFRFGADFDELLVDADTHSCGGMLALTVM